MTSPRQLSDNFFALPQIAIDEIPSLQAQGFTSIVCNRPDGEDADQPTAAAIATAAIAAGMAFQHIPVTGGSISEADIIRTQSILESNVKTLAYCRSGTRSSILHAFASVRSGKTVEDALGAAMAAGYDLSAQRTALNALTEK